MKVLLVFPREPGTCVSNDSVLPFPLLGLTQLAATFPDHYELKLVDESVRPVRAVEPADLVCITTMTATVKRAYALADRFLAHDIPVVLGGAHATVLPDEAARHATSVVVGEAENVMPQLIEDFEQGRLARRYQADAFTSLVEMPAPRVDLLNWRHRFFLSSLQTSRGCPNSCNFCSVPAIFGRRLRLKPIDTIKAELEAAARHGSRYLFVVDDNFTANRQRAREIMDLFSFYKMRWMGFSTLAMAEDGEFLDALRRSNCVSLFVGFESLHQRDNFIKNKKYADPAAVSHAVKIIHEAGIGIQGSFIFGFEHDTPEVFGEVAAFIQENEIEVPNVNILTPFPGTTLYADMEKQGRILHHDWDRYDMNHVVYQPRSMTVEELQQGYAWTLKYLASPTVILKRLSWRRPYYPYFLMANFSLHRALTKLAKSGWNRDIQKSLESRGACLC
ncbi:MAG: B12-binding domain-containing radical SAM protein [Desulfobulbaceae bacterium]|nr:MAG: B12-binding domain-containing radical SAM protein [Desulfobulbaceae bacterium]